MNTADYERYVELMCKSVNSAVDPTVDFINYARGNFQEEIFDKSQGNYLPTINGGNCQENVLLNETIKYPSLVKARNYYKSHVKEFPIILKNKHLTNFCGTFPAFDDEWQSDKFDWIKASAILSSMHFRITMSYGSDFVDGHRKITISVIGPDDYPVADKCEVLRDMNVPEDKIPEIIADFDLIEEKFNLFTTNDGYPNFERLKKTYAELKQEKFDYCKFIEICLGDILKEDDVFIINNLEPGYFDKFTNMFEEVGPRVMANYITFKVASQMQNTYYSSVMVNRYFAPAIMAAGFSTFWSKEVGERRKEVVSHFKKSFETVKDCFKKECSSQDSSLEIEDEEILEFIDANFNQEQIEEEYKDVEIDPDDFMKNFLYLRKCGYTPSSKMSHKLDIQSGVYSKAVQLLNFLLHHYNRPMFFYFSGWELRMWYNQICECRFEEESEEFLILEKCAKKQIDDRKLKTTNYSMDFWIKHCIGMIGALRLSYLDYSRWMAANEDQVKVEENILQKFGLNCRKAFFISFVQHECFAEGLTLNPVILALINSQEFRDVFNCSTDSPMVDKDRCMIMWN